jgi:drug/metabolite transporter (DMT)-like permease
MHIPKYKFLNIAAFIAIYVIWGSTYLLNKIVVTEIPPFLLASIRFLSAGLLIFIIAKFLKYDISINKRQLINSIIAGFLFLVYGNGVFVWALKYVDSGFAALEAALQPLFVLALMRVVNKTKILPKAYIGVALGILGMYLLVSQQGLNPNENSVTGILMILTCVLSWSYGTIFVAKAELPPNFFVATGYQMLFGGTMLLFASFLFGEEWTSPLSWSGQAQISMVLLILFGSIIAFTAFNYLLKVVSADKVATSAYVNPLIAIILGWYVLDEHISLQSIIAAIVLLTGVYFINRKKRIF